MLMSKFHINKHGVPAPCKATKGNCPYGGDSGNENHFDTQEEAQEHAKKILSAEYGLLPVADDSDRPPFEGLRLEDFHDNIGSFVTFEVDGERIVSGEIRKVEAKNGGNYAILRDEYGKQEKVELNQVTDWKDDFFESDEAYTSYQMGRRAKQLTNLINKRKSTTPEPDLPKDNPAIRNFDDLDTQIELRDEYITSQEHDPVKTVQSMFDHVAGKSGKLYRYDDKENPYLETHEYDFERTMRRHEAYLEREGYFENYPDGWDDFERNLDDHRKLHDYSRKLAVDYGKDFEKKVALSGEYNEEEKAELQKGYRDAIASKISEFLVDEEW